MRSRWVVVLMLVALSPAAAHADLRSSLEDYLQPQDYQQEISAASDMLLGSITRTRRAIALGPHVGGFGGSSLSPGDAIGGISFGLSLFTFDLPTVLDLRQILQDTLKARVSERIKAILASGGQVPSREEVLQLVREVVAEVKAELFGKRAGKTLEKPKLGLLLEGVRLLSPGGW